MPTPQIGEAMNSSERAEQLAQAILGENSYQVVGKQHATRLIEEFTADSAILARGVAIEQAAQIVLMDFCEKATCDIPSHNQAWRRAEQIRSLDPDAAQALAHHNARVFHDTLDDLKHDGSELVVGGKEPVRIFSEASLAAHDAELNTLIDNQRVALGEARIDINNLLALLMAHQENTKEYLESDDAAVLNDIEERWRTPSGRNWLKDHDAEIERRARLDEAEWWRYLVMMHEESYFAVEGDKRLAALAKSQPAPAKQDEAETKQ